MLKRVQHDVILAKGELRGGAVIPDTGFDKSRFLTTFGMTRAGGCSCSGP